VQGAAADKPRALRTLLPLLLLVVAMCSIQLGSALAKTLFPVIGARGTSVLRLGFAALILCAAFRVWRLAMPAGSWSKVARYGAALGLMNLFFYLALQRLPLGIVVALEFTGPLAVALWHSRRAVDFFWAGVAILGLALLVPWQRSLSVAGIDVVGIGYALGAGFFWALYIVWGREAGLVAGTASVAVGMAVGALIVLPVGVLPALPALSAPALLGTALAVALLSGVLPYTLEMLALTQLPSRVFGVSMSMEPAIAALSGWMVLGERLSALQYLAIAAVMVASGGAAWSDRESGSRA
jgi:inner membrane transporter RhtA